MGWTCTPGQRKDELLWELNQSEDGWEIIKSVTHEVDSNTIHVWQQVKIRLGTLIVLILIEKNDNGDWAHKTLDESMGMFHNEGLPMQWLDEVDDPKLGYSTKWRQERKKATVG